MTRRCSGPLDITTPAGRAHASKVLGEDNLVEIEAWFRDMARHLPLVKCTGCDPLMRIRAGLPWNTQ